MSTVPAIVSADEIATVEIEINEDFLPKTVFMDDAVSDLAVAVVKQITHKQADRHLVSHTDLDWQFFVSPMGIHAKSVRINLNEAREQYRDELDYTAYLDFEDAVENEVYKFLHRLNRGLQGLVGKKSGIEIEQSDQF
jgi:hypothetical protein